MGLLRLQWALAPAVDSTSKSRNMLGGGMAVVRQREKEQASEAVSQ